jgi:small subunit ribosomal protein S19
MARENESNEVDLRRKDQTFRGKTLDELKALDVREFAKLLSSNRKRNVLRNFQEHEKFLSLVRKKGKKSIKTHKRDMVILPGLVGFKINIYNGKEFAPVEITFDMLGHKLGEFSMTRIKARHTKDEKGQPKIGQPAPDKK